MSILNPSLESIRYEAFFQKAGIRTASHLLRAKYLSIQNFELPQKSIVHFSAESGLALGIDPSDIMIKDVSGLIVAKHVYELVGKKGTPISTKVIPKSLEDKYRKQYRTIRPLKKLDTVIKDPHNVVVINYSMLSHLFKYRATFQTRLFIFENMLETMVAEINTLANVTNHNQFLRIDLPEQLPTKPMFIRGSSAPLNRTTLPFWPDDKSLLLLELWKWLGPQRHTSILSKLSPKGLDRLNLTIVESGKFTILNMGKLDEWRADVSPVGSVHDNEEESAENAELRNKRASGMAPEQMQLNFLKFLAATFAMRTVTSKTTIISRNVTDEDGEDRETIIGGTIDGMDMDEDDLEFLEDDDTDVEFEYDEDGIAERIETDATAYVPVIEEDSPDTVEPPSGEVQVHTRGILEVSNDLLNDGLISVPEHRRFERLADNVAKIKNPFGTGEGSLLDFVNTKPKVVVDGISQGLLKDKKSIFDKSLIKSSLRDFDKDYVEQVLHYDLARCILALQDMGIIVKDVNREVVKDANSEYELYSVSLIPVGGAPTTISFKLPLIRNDGTYMSSGVKYRMRKQRGDLPIRKVSPTRVALTSYASKLNIDRSDRVVNNYTLWLLRQVTVATEEGTVKVTSYGNSTDSSIRVPRPFSILATKFKGLTYKNFKFNFNIEELKATYPKEMEATLKVGDVVVGTRGKDILTMSSNGVIAIEAKGEILGTIEEIFDIPTMKQPMEQCDVNLYGKRIPVAIVLGYTLGFSNLLRSIKAEYRQVPKGQRIQLEPGEFTIKFADQTLVFASDQKEVELIVNSLNSMKAIVKGFEYEDFDNPDIWGTLLEQEGMGVRFIREVANLHTGFIDPITRDLLIEYNLPLTFQELVRESVRMLMNDDHPAEMDGDYMRIKGYERIPGLVYSHLLKSVRNFKGKPLTAKASVELHPYVIWTDIQKDPSNAIVEESNPIHELKEMENVTYAGTGGRSSRTMVRRTRAFNPSDLGLISEATVDSSDVGVTIYTSPNPKLASIRGTSKPGVDFSDHASLMSTSALVCPASDKDDPKRINFINIQMSHTVVCKGYKSFPVRTGYEQCIGQRTSSLFTVRAQGIGRVTKSTPTLLVIEYEDDSLPNDHIEIGRKYGTVTGKTIPHDIVTDLGVGDEVKPQDVVAWNSGFFERDYFNPDDVVWMAGIPVKVALLDGHETIEDSCQVDEWLVGELEMPKTGLRELTFTVDQDISELVSVGDTVNTESILCIVEDSSTAGTDFFDSTTLDTLSVMSRNTPRAQYSGRVSKVEVIYNADIDDMSAGMRELVETSDKARASRAKRLKSDDVRTGYASDLPIDTIIIKVYIDSTLSAADGDKVIAGHQLKSTIANVMNGVNETVSGMPINLKFGYLSVEDRITGAFIAQGTAATLMALAGKRACKAFRDNL